MVAGSRASGRWRWRRWPGHGKWYIVLLPEPRMNLRRRRRVRDCAGQRHNIGGTGLRPGIRSV